MAVDRYVKIVLTIIALELFWIGIKDTAPPVVAQAAARRRSSSAASSSAASQEYLPVGIVGSRCASNASRR